MPTMPFDGACGSRDLISQEFASWFGSRIGPGVLYGFA